MLAEALNSNHIQVLNWNIAKGSRSGWERDLAHLAQPSDLVIIQEAKLEYDIPQLFGSECCWTFAPGFTRRDHSTGVMTLSRAHTVNHTQHSHREPWTRLPKAALISEYRLEGMASTLLVANIHAINFTAGIRSFRQQLESVLQEFAAHKGPIICSGDFNTWRRKRLNIVDELIIRNQLEPIRFTTDHRKQAFGMALDHIFVRGLVKKTASVRSVGSSDHNPMTVTLSVDPAQSVIALPYSA